MHITDYFHKIENVLSKHPAIVISEVSYEQRTRHLGFIKGYLTFRDKSELHFKEFIDVETEIKKYKYGYHYQKENKIIFRYDNHSGTDHKHSLGEENIILCSLPSLEDILKEIFLLLD